MKIRTKLILLLSAALVVTMLVSTWLRIRWTQRRLEDQLRQSAQDTAVAIADELVKTAAQRHGSGRDRPSCSRMPSGAIRARPTSS